MYASVIASGSRAGTVLCTAALVLVPVLVSLKGILSGRDVGAMLGKLVVGVAGFTAVVGWETIWKRLTTTDPYFLRREFTMSSLEMVSDRPWFGWGLGSWPFVYPAYAVVDFGVFANRAHNQWLEWAADGGISFSVLLLALALWTIRPAFRTVWGIGVLAVFLHGTVDYPFSRPQLAAWPIAMIALLAAGKSTSASSGLPQSSSTASRL
jgi:O-antigen ligase